MQGPHLDRMQLLTERRKLQTEVENKKRQLEDDRRALQHLKSKTLRERWLLDSGSSSGPVQNQELDQDQARTRNLEKAIFRLEQELLCLEAEAMHEDVTHAHVTPEPVPEYREVTKVEVQETPQTNGVKRAPAEVKGHKEPRIHDNLKRAMYSVQITVERDRLTGETRVLSTSTTPPVDLNTHTQQVVKVYEDQRKVVHAVDGEDGVLLSSSEVDELLLKADRITMATQEEEPEEEPEEEQPCHSVEMATAEIAGLEAEPGGQPDVGEASEENPVTMVFMGYQNVEDEDHTKKVLGLRGAVRAELVLLDEEPPTSATATPTTPPSADPVTATPLATTPVVATPIALAATPTALAAVPATSVATPTAPPPVTKKEKSPCRCCSVM